MGIFKFFKKSDKHSDDERRENVDSPPIKRRRSFKRTLSSESMKKIRQIREIGRCLRLIGDDVDQLSREGSRQDLSNQNNQDQADTQADKTKNLNSN